MLVTDRAGQIWTAYGDEGIYGRNPQSWLGVGGWDDKGVSVWPTGGKWPKTPLAGFTGATEDEHVWLVWYASASKGDTFLTRVTPRTGEEISTPSPIESPDGFAVSGDRAVLTRRHHKKPRTQVTGAELADGHRVVTEQKIIEVPGSVLWGCGRGRDGLLWLRTGDSWICLR